MTKNKVSSIAITALIDALTNIYWYKKDLKIFLYSCLNNAQLINTLNWEDYKRNIVTSLINYLVKNQDVYQDDLLRLIEEVVKVKDYSHLLRLDDGKEKAIIAEESVSVLKKIYQTHENLMTEKKKIEERRKKIKEEQAYKKGLQIELEAIKNRFYGQVNASSPQSRGYELEKILKELFALFDLDSKASFKIKGEQIDGAFTFDYTDFLLEAKWQQNPVGIQELDAFEGKIYRKLDNVLGLFISINGFSKDAVETYSRGRSLMLLMDGADLVEVLEGRMDLKDLLLLKRRHASQTGNIYLNVRSIIND